MDTLQWIEVGVNVLAVVGGSGLLATIFPNASRLSGALLMVRKVLDVVAANWGNARNLD